MFDQITIFEPGLLGASLAMASNPAIEKHSSFKSNLVTHKIQPLQFTATSINTLGSSQAGSVDKSNTKVGTNQKEFLPGNEPDELIVQRKVSTSKRNIKNMINVFEAANDGSYTNASDFKNKLKGEITVVISEKKTKQDTFNEVKIINKAKKFLKKYSLKDTVDLILETEKVNKKNFLYRCKNTN